MGACDPDHSVEICSTAADPVFVSGVSTAGEAHLGEVGGHLSGVTTEMARPTGTDIYAALDAVSNSTSAPTVITFANLARIAGGSGYIVGARLLTDQATCVARFKLHLFHTAPSAINDNAPYTLLYANRANRIGSVTLPAASTEGTGSTAASAHDLALRIPFVCAAADRNVYGLLETLDVFTPASAQQFAIELRADLN